MPMSRSSSSSSSKSKNKKSSSKVVKMPRGSQKKSAKRKPSSRMEHASY